VLTRIAIAMFLLVCQAGHAQPPRDPRRPGGDDPIAHVGPEEGKAAARKAAQPGPATIILPLATLRLPAGMSFVPRKEAMYFLAMHGQGPTPETLGMVFPDDDWSAWHAVLQYKGDGYVSDADAAWDPQATLAGIRRMGAQSDVGRMKANPGWGPFEYTGWFEPPTYLRDSRTLAWGLLWRETAPRPMELLSYRIVTLGRGGYFDWSFRIPPDRVPRDRETLRRLWTAIEFEPGQRYIDFKPIDRRATVTLRQLGPGQ
jgi:uncharacterized membrane-anchored protein